MACHFSVTTSPQITERTLHYLELLKRSDLDISSADNYYHVTPIKHATSSGYPETAKLLATALKFNATQQAKTWDEATKQKASPLHGLGFLEVMRARFTVAPAAVKPAQTEESLLESAELLKLNK